MGNFGKCFLKVEEDGICLYSIVDIVMHVHKPMRVDANTEADVATLALSHKCDSWTPSSEDSKSTWLDGATAVVPNDHNLAR